MLLCVLNRYKRRHGGYSPRSTTFQEDALQGAQAQDIEEHGNIANAMPNFKFCIMQPNASIWTSPLAPGRQQI